MAKTKVIFTTSYSGRNLKGLYPAHVLDILSEQQADLLNYHEMQEKYTAILSPNNGRMQYWINWLDTKDFKEDYTNSGHKRYKSVNVP